MRRGAAACGVCLCCVCCVSACVGLQYCHGQTRMALSLPVKGLVSVTVIRAVLYKQKNNCSVLLSDTVVPVCVCMCVCVVWPFWAVPVCV